MSKEIDITPDEAMKRVEALIAEIEEDIRNPDNVPSDYVLLRRLDNMSIVTWRRWARGERDEQIEKQGRSGKGYSVKYAEVAELWRLFCEHYWQWKGGSDPKYTGFAAFALKQQKNGGWTDKQQTEHSGTVNFQLALKNGGDGNPFE